VEGVSHGYVPSWCAGSDSDEDGGLLDLAIDGEARFVRLALEIEEPGHVLAVAAAFRGEDLGGDPVGALVEPQPLQAKQTPIDRVGDPIRPEMDDVRRRPGEDRLGQAA